jgi:hypothetical protein
MVKCCVSIPDFWYKKIKEANLRISHLVIVGYKALTEQRTENLRINEIELKLTKEIELLRARMNKIEQKVKVYG